MKTTTYAPMFSKQLKDMEKLFLKEVESFGCKPIKKTLEVYPQYSNIAMRVEAKDFDENGKGYIRGFQFDINVDHNAFTYGVKLERVSIYEE